MDNLDEKYKSKNPFTVPDGYFQNLGERVMERVQEANEPKRVFWAQAFKSYLGLAALFAFAMIVVQFVLPLVVDKDKMLMKEQDYVETTQVEEESVFDADFNPSREEIIEYLAQEANVTEVLFAESL